MQVWDTAKYDKKSRTFTFEFDGETFEIAPAVVEEALKQPALNNQNPNYITYFLFPFVRSLGYNGETTKIGGLFRTKLKKE